MGSLADFIEQYLQNILLTQEKVELQRQELAKMFRCAPSQINYVLETRFTFDRGYLVESKRGGGGYIRITQVPWDNQFDVAQHLEQLIPEELGEDQVECLLDGLIHRELIDRLEAQLCLELLNKYFSDLPHGLAAGLRAKLVKALLLVMVLKQY